MNITGRIFASISIIIIGFAISCGGNILIIFVWSGINEIFIESKTGFNELMNIFGSIFVIEFFIIVVYAIVKLFGGSNILNFGKSILYGGIYYGQSIVKKQSKGVPTEEEEKGKKRFLSIFIILLGLLILVGTEYFSGITFKHEIEKMRNPNWMYQNNDSFYYNYIIPWGISIAWILYIWFTIVSIANSFFNKNIPLIPFLHRKNIPKNMEPLVSTLIYDKESYNLFSILAQVDISSIASVRFIPRNGVGFTIKTPNMKRLAVYITSKLGKTIFNPEELRKSFDYVVKNISSDLSKRDFDLVTGKIDEFVKSGGEVKINRI